MTKSEYESKLIQIRELRQEVDRPLEETILYAVAGNTGLELERK